MGTRRESPAAIGSGNEGGVTKTVVSASQSNIETGNGNGNELPAVDDSPKSDKPVNSTPPTPPVSSTFRLILLACMVVQNSSVVLVGRHTRTSGAKKEDLFVVSQFILVTEIAKFLGSCILESYTTGGKLLQSVRENILSNPMDSLKVSVPALLYLLQNTVLYVALSNLSAPLFQVLYQSKILTTAIVSVFLLGRRYTLRQWVCLTTLGIGVAIVVLGEKAAEVSGGGSSSGASSAILSKDDKLSASEIEALAAAAVASEVESVDSSPAAAAAEQPHEQNIMLGLTCVMTACLSSAFAGVYFEKVVKKPSNSTSASKSQQPVSLWMRNVQLAFFSICIAWVQCLREGSPHPFLHGFNGWVWLLVFLQAGGGLLIAAIIKYADNVLKGLATGVAVAVSTFCSMILFGTPLTMQFTIGATIILGSVYFFSNSGGKGKKKSGDDAVVSASSGRSSTELKPLVLPK